MNEDGLLALLVGADAPDRERLMRLDPRFRSPCFLDRLVAAALARPDLIELAREALGVAVEADRSELPRFARAADLFIEQMLRQDAGNPRIWRVIADLERAGHRHGAPFVVARACWHRMVIALIAEDLPRVFEAGDALLDKIEILANAREDELSHDGRSALSQHLFEAAKYIYYEGDSAQLAVALIDAALQFDPFPQALRMAGSAHMRTGNTRRARECLMNLVRTDEAIAADFYSLGSLESELGDLPAAVAALQHAVRLNPENGVYALQLSRALLDAGELESAELVLADASEKCQLMQAMDATASDETRHTYVTSRGDRFRLDEAVTRGRLNVFNVALSQGRPDLARRQWIAMQAASPTPPSVLLRSCLSQILWVEGARTEALATLSSVVDEIATDEVRLIRAEWLIETGDLDRALADISVVVRGWQSTERAAKLLRRVLDIQPDNAPAFRLLACELARPTGAEVLTGMSMLDGIIKGDPTDAFALYCRGLARIAIGPDRGPDRDSIHADLFSGFLDLCLAREAAPQDAQIIHAWRWVIDRLAADHRFLGVWLQLRSEPGGIGRVASRECHALLAMSEAVRLGVNKRHGDAVEALRTARDSLVVAGLPATASLCDLLLADNLLRLHDLEEARRCLDAFDRDFMVICTRPLSPILAEAVRARERNRADSVTPEIVYHLEFMHIQLWSVQQLRPMRDMLQAEFLSRLGRHDEALATVADRATELLSDPAPSPQMVGGVENLAIILRNANAQDRALAVLEHARPHADSRNGFRLDNLRATLLMEAGDLDSALPLLESMWPADPKAADDPMFDAVRGNLASLYARKGRPQRAVELLTPMLARASNSPLVRLKLHLDLLVACAALDRVDEVCDHASAILESFNEMRASMSRLEDRQRLAGEYESHIDTALEALLLASRVDELFAAVEALRGRSWQEQHVRRTAVLSADASALDAKIERAERIESLLMQLQIGVKQLGPNYIDADILAQLRSLDPHLQLFDRSPGEARIPVAGDKGKKSFIDRIAHSLSSCRVALAQAREQRERLFLRASAATDLVTPAGLHAALRAAATSEQRVVFVHVLSVDDKLVLLRVASDHDKAALTRTSASAAALATFAHSSPAMPQAENAWLEMSAALVEIVEPDDAVILCVTGALARVPFHALPVACAPWCARNPISQAPSGTSLVRCLQQPQPKGSALVVGDPTGDLPRGRDEARSVAELLGVAPLLGNEATVAAVRSALESATPSVVHFACHGTAGRGDDAFPALQLARASPTDDGCFTVATLNDALLPGIRAVLSACDSAHAEGPTGTEVFGLPRALLIAGARSVVASLWETDDTATFLLMQRFYVLLPKMHLSTALAQAQLWLRGLTIAEVVTHAEESLTKALAPDTRARLLRHLAAEQVRAHDHAAARGSLERLLAETPEDQAVAEHAQARRLLRLLAESGEPREALDYGSRPFCHASIWAPFVLMGDWR